MSRLVRRSLLSYSGHRNTRASSDLSSLRSALISRKLPLLYDFLVPTPSVLLHKSLQDFLPAVPEPYRLLTNPRELPYRDRGLDIPAVPLPPAHHLVYFVTPTTASELLPDGTDLWHSPGEPFTARMWAGGRIRFLPDKKSRLALDGNLAVCVEGIRDVQIKGREGDEKVWVGIERRIGYVEDRDAHDKMENEDTIRKRLWTQSGESEGDAMVIERRNLVFMKPSSAQSRPATKSPSSPRKSLEPPADPAYAHTLTPTPSLLFRYSALTFNAHSIHLDTQYATQIEHYPGTLVHGPLSLTFLLTCLRYHLLPLKRRIREIEYKNLAPLYCGRPMKVCGKPLQQASEGSTQTMDGDEPWLVWIEDDNGSVAVKGTVSTVKTDFNEDRATFDTGIVI